MESKAINLIFVICMYVRAMFNRNENFLSKELHYTIKNFSTSIIRLQSIYVIARYFIYT